MAVDGKKSDLQSICENCKAMGKVDEGGGCSTILGELECCTRDCQGGGSTRCGMRILRDRLSEKVCYERFTLDDYEKHNERDESIRKLLKDIINLFRRKENER